MALETQIRLWPLRARKNPFAKLIVRSVYNQDKIAIKLKWKDPTEDSIINNKYVDQGAIQFAVQISHSFGLMGIKSILGHIACGYHKIRLNLVRS